MEGLRLFAWPPCLRQAGGRRVSRWLKRRDSTTKGVGISPETSGVAKGKMGGGWSLLLPRCPKKESEAYKKAASLRHFLLKKVAYPLEISMNLSLMTSYPF